MEKQCGNSPKYFPQLVCTKPRGHQYVNDMMHSDGEYSWEVEED